MISLDQESEFEENKSVRKAVISDEPVLAELVKDTDQVVESLSPQVDDI